MDLVVNHTAREHAWARRAVAGDLAYRDFYLVYPDRTLPDAYERTLPEVFPDIAPGSFTHVPEMGGWVWTTFNDYQWDLDHSNPAVFRAMLATMLGPPTAGWTCRGWTPCPSCGSGWAPTARTSRRRTCWCRPSGR